ncbi:MAG: hypothetical protein RLZZ399_3028 [Verrucomicrobiota bacterium]|jgi:capsular exopolysaccharide synthesis family protein
MDNPFPRRRHPFADETEGPDWRSLLLGLREHWGVIAALGILGALAAFWFISGRPTLYRATAVLQVETPKAILGFEPSPPQNAAPESSVQGAIESFKSRSLLRWAAAEMALSQDPQFAPQPISQEQAGNLLLKCIRVQLRRGTQLLEISAEHSNPQQAKKLANGMAEAFLRHSEEQRLGAAQHTLQFLGKEAEQLKARLQRSETALQNYMETQNAASLDEKQDTLTAALKAQAANLSTARSLRIRLQTDIADMERFQNQPEALISVASISQHPAVLSQQNQINELQSRVSGLRLRYTDKHPKLVLANQQLEDARRTLQRVVLQIPETLRAELDRALATERNFEAALKEQERLSLSLNRQSIAYNVLARDVETDRSLYQAVLKRLKETDAASGIPSDHIHFFESATLPETPVSQNRLRFIALGLFAGSLFGTVLLASHQLLRDAWRSVDSLENATGMPVLAAIPFRKELSKKARLAQLLRNPNHPLLESFRSLRTSLHIHARRDGKSCFLFTSALPGDGKSLCSMGYALSLAQQGVRTLLIDADLRRPCLAKRLLGTDQLPGFTDLISGKSPISDTIFTTETENLDLLPGGQILSNASELLTAARVDILLQNARERYDCVIIDCAPVLPVSDAILLSHAVDSVCLVVRYGVTGKKLTMRALHLLSDANAPLEGVILNSVSPSALPQYYPDSFRPIPPLPPVGALPWSGAKATRSSFPIDA